MEIAKNGAGLWGRPLGTQRGGLHACFGEDQVSASCIQRVGPVSSAGAPEDEGLWDGGILSVRGQSGLGWGQRGALH